VNFRFARVRTSQLLGIAHWALRPYGPPFHFGTLDQLIAIVATLWEIEDAAQVILRAGVQSFNFPCMSLEGVAHRKRFDLFRALRDLIGEALDLRSRVGEIGNRLVTMPA